MGSLFLIPDVLIPSVLFLGLVSTAEPAVYEVTRMPGQVMQELQSTGSVKDITGNNFYAPRFLSAILHWFTATACTQNTIITSALCVRVCVFMHLSTYPIICISVC